ncbi:ABC transporter ATP-binding protein [Fulvimonas soli]|uniref:ABC-2 type transport system ATP-binding protein n=1 Tax=Fulvimonas soli TaxID=155197 RepID=A0A316IHA1_9GAMM|nr:ABC transporter ATP-binding protein [Fulvimonas soli]PWK86625.1 ABC-2 type transport system ATP-binding protein [Fulvimonas soli]TNY25553.1 ABC transporter ATP-binding protein [Fulvimonas soli]
MSGSIAVVDPPAVRAAAPALAVRGLRKAFGKREVLRGVDWQVPAGRVIGLLGRNGAGKTTLLRCLLGLSPLDAGEVELFGEPMTEPGGERLHRIGFVPQSFDLFPWMKVRGYLDFTAAFYARWNHELARRLLADWELDPRQKIGELSQGQRQKLAIVRAIAPEPDLLVLDEPVASLDPQARRAFMGELLALMRAPGKTVIFSTHITADLERADADIALLREGRMQFTRPLAELRRHYARAVLARPGGWTQAPALPGALGARIAGDELHLLTEDVPAERLHALAQEQGATLRLETPSLEDLFVELA